MTSVQKIQHTRFFISNFQPFVPPTHPTVFGPSLWKWEDSDKILTKFPIPNFRVYNLMLKPESDYRKLNLI